MERNLRKAYTEVSKVLSYMDPRYVEMIPQKFKTLLENEKILDYTPYIDLNLPLAKQNFQRETFIILAILNLNYWCESKERKKILIAIYAENDKKREKAIKEKYNPDNLFKSKKNINNQIVKKSQEEISLIKYKEKNFILKLIDKIKNILNK